MDQALANFGQKVFVVDFLTLVVQDVKDINNLVSLAAELGPVG